MHGELLPEISPVCRISCIWILKGISDKDMLASNHKLILRNTGMLYIRMLLAMAVGLYTSRLVLDVLGVEDFGTYYVVAGFVTLLGFMQGAMTTATQRYFAFDLGENNGSNLRSLFNTSLQIHALMAVCIALIAETAGYWFVSNQLTIAPDRLVAALAAYHLSVAAFAVSVMTIPLTAMLMAHERMGLFAMISMADVLLKLTAVLLLPYFGCDKLITYAAFMLLVGMITFNGYLLVSRFIFASVRFQWAFDVVVFHKMLVFTVWNTWGNMAAVLSEHGNNVLLNIFFGPVVNASRSIATQANGALNQFVTNVQAAVNPQIVKLYASGDRQIMHDLVQRASRYNFFLLLVMAMPVLLYAQQLLDIWLVETPEYAALFLRLALIVSLIDSISRPLMTSAQATGKIALYQSVVGGVLLLNVPVSYLLIKIWPHPAIIMLSGILVALAAMVARLLILKSLTGLLLDVFVKVVVFRAILVVSFSGLLNCFLFLNEAFNLLLAVGLVGSLLCTFFVVWIIGLDAAEKRFLLVIVGKVLKR